MPAITGTIKDSSGSALSGRLTITLDGQIVDTTTTPDSILVPKSAIVTITNGVVNINLLESETKNLTYRFVFETSQTTLIYYLQNGVVYTGPKNYTSGQWWTGGTFVNGTSQLLTEEEDTKFTTHFDFRAIVPNQPSVEFGSLVPTGITTDILDTGLARLAEILTNNVDYIEALRGGPRWRGIYSPTVYYQRDDAVSYGGSTWIWIDSDPDAGVTPSISEPRWFLAAEKGTAGGTGGQDTPYNAVGWNGQTWAPSANAIRDVIETLATTASLSAYAPINAPTFTGAPSSPTPPSDDNSTRIATTAWTRSYAAPIDNPTFTGNPSCPTPSLASNSNRIATTSWINQFFTQNLGLLAVATHTSTSTSLTLNVFNTISWTATDLNIGGVWASNAFTAPASAWYRVTANLRVGFTGGSAQRIAIGLFDGSTQIAFLVSSQPVDSALFAHGIGEIVIFLSQGVAYNIRILPTVTSGSSAVLAAVSGVLTNRVSFERLTIS